MNGTDEVIRAILIESQKNLDQVDRDLVPLEGDPHNRDVLASVDQAIHTINGICSFFNFQGLGAIASTGENVLGKRRDGNLQLAPDIISGLLALMDGMRPMLASIESAGAEEDNVFAAIMQRLTRLQDADKSTTPNASQQMPQPELRNGSFQESTIRVSSNPLVKMVAANLVLGNWNTNAT
ncbi:MAG TPA: Hpt domain-containing protein [Gemmataceae bacterium]|nr:Hpt domain-containing protein [Gemmataceae bacterium]